jgi:integrase
MNTPIELNAEAKSPNSIQLTIVPKPRKEPKEEDQRFKVKEFINASNTTSYRVDGYKRDRTRIRENFADKNKALARQLELQTEWLTGEVRSEVQATKLTRQQIALAEAAFIRLNGEDEDLPRAIEYWLTHGKKLSVDESPRLDEAVDSFLLWLSATETLRQRTKGKYKSRVNLFRNSVPNLRVSEFRSNTIKAFFEKRNVSPRTKIGDKEAISVFFEWCISHEPQWTAINPCKGVEIECSKDGKEVAILSVKECRKLLTKAQGHRRGRVAPYIAVCLFGGLRPTEAQRLKWDKVNLKDGKIRVEAQSSKRKEARVITIGKTLSAWLKRYEDKPFAPANLRRDLEVIKRAAGYTGRGSRNAENKLKPWPADVLRHTGVSHFFQQCGEYGRTAQWAGNSEEIIRKHYDACVSSADTKAFYAIMPKKGGRK